MATTVKELIDKLQKMPPDANVQLIDTNSGYTYVPDTDDQEDGAGGVSSETFEYTNETVCWITIEEA